MKIVKRKSGALIIWSLLFMGKLYQIHDDSKGVDTNDDH